MDAMSTPGARLRTIGILGGMGPAAAIDLQARVLAATPASRDRDHVPVVVWNVPQVPDRVAAILGGGESPLGAMLAGARALEAAGAEAIAIACNTAHHWADELAAALGVPLLHIADAATAALDRRSPRPRTVGLLATRGTLASGFYARRLERRGLAWIAPGEDIQEASVDPAIAAVKAGDRAGAARHFRAAATALRDRGADVLLLACTELPLAAAGSGLEDRCLDANLALAEAIVAWSRGGEAPR